MILGALADDLTGGLELAAMLVAEGVPCLLATSAQAAQRSQAMPALVIAQKTRIAPAARACELFDTGVSVLLERGARQVFYKYCATFDSTDAGNIGPCIDVLTARTGSRFTACCPTFPEYRRAVFQGHLFVGDRLVSESPKRHDPVTPMHDPDLVRVLQRQTRQRIGLLAHGTVRAGPQAIAARVAALQAEGCGCAIADATEHEDLAHLARATVDWSLMTGGSSIAAHYPALWRERGWLDRSAATAGLPAVHAPGVVLAGSCADQTRAQLAEFARSHPVRTLDLLAHARGHQGVEDALAWAAQYLPAGPVALATAADPDQVAAIQGELGGAQAAALAEQLLGRIAAGLRDRGVRRFVVAGGETSGAVLEWLGIEQLRVGPFAGASLPLAQDAARDPDDPLVVCLKSGKLGGLDAFAVALDGMARGSACAPDRETADDAA